MASRLSILLVLVAVLLAVAGPRLVEATALNDVAAAVPTEIGADRSGLHTPGETLAFDPDAQAPAGTSDKTQTAPPEAVPSQVAPPAAAAEELTPADESGGEVVFFSQGAEPSPTEPLPRDYSSSDAPVTETEPAPATEPPAPAFDPIRAAFYYPWFPQAWSQSGIQPFTAFHPTLGYYGSGDAQVVRTHVSAMQYGHIDVGISSWWGQGDYTDANFQTALQVSGGTGFQWAVYYEPEGWGTPSVDRIRADLDYIARRYASDSSYLRIDGRFVVFVYSSPEDRCEMVSRWQEAAPSDAFLVLKAFPNYRDCAGQTDSWHHYNPLVATAGLGTDSFAISPGYVKPGDSQVIARDLGRWRENVREMADSPARFQLVLTFNEWGEGTAVESATEWASPSGYGAYLDVLHEIEP